MKFKDRLFEMAKAGKAFMHRHKDKTIVIVAYGKYAGKWLYDKRSKRLRWSHHWAPYYDGASWSSCGKSWKFSLPEEVYALYGSKHAGRLHAAYKKELGLATCRWLRFKQHQIDGFKHMISSSSINAGKDYNGYHGYVAACAYNMPLAARILSDNREDALIRFRHISRLLPLLHNMLPARRQRLVTRILRLPLDKALQLSFRKTSPDIIKEISDPESRQLYFSDYNVLYVQSNTGAVSREIYSSLYKLCLLASKQKSFRSFSVSLWQE